MQTISRLVLQHKLLTTLAWLVLTGLGGFGAVNLEDRMAGQLAQPGQAAYEANQAIVRAYGTGGENPPIVPVITLPAGGAVDDPTTRQALAAAFEAAAEATDARVAAYPNTGDRRFVGTDARTTFGLVFTDGGGGMGGGGNDIEAVTGAMRAAMPAGATLAVTGMDALEEQPGGGISLLAEVVIGAVGALAVLAFVFGSLLAFVPLLIAAVSILTAFLIVFGLTQVTEVSMIVQFVVGLVGLGVAIDYSLLLVTRWREELAHGHRGDEAVIRAMDTAGRAVILSGAAVAIGMVALVFIPVPALRSIGWGGLVIPAVSVAAVLTLLPVVLATVGQRLDWPHLRRDATVGRGWSAWARVVVRHRWLAAVGSGAVLLALAGAALGLQLGEPDSSSLASSGLGHEGLQSLRAAGIPTGVLTPTEVLVPAGTDPGVTAATLAKVEGVYAVLVPDTPAWRADGTTVLSVLPAQEGGTDAGKATVERIQATVPTGVEVGGGPAQSMGFVDSVYGAFPLVLAVITVVTFLVLARGFRSLVLPLKAVLLNLLSLGAIIGAIVLVWQYGYGSELIWGIAATGSVTEFVPIMIFAFLYGLSMDYEVFILARIREEYDACGSTTQAVAVGIGRTGRLVTSAALILFLAFASLAASPATEIKVFATGLGLGVLLDATLIRALLVPALVALLDRWNWWFPNWAARLLRVAPRILPAGEPAATASVAGPPR